MQRRRLTQASLYLDDIIMKRGSLKVFCHV